MTALFDLGIDRVDTIRLNGACRHCKHKLSTTVQTAYSRRGDVVFSHPSLELRAVTINDDSTAWLRCTCGHGRHLRKVQGKYRATIKCDGRCMAATGCNCECSCGGANHGAAYAA